MKKTIYSFLVLVLCAGFVYSQNVPELMYYKFENNTSTTTPNYASAPVGTNPAPIIGSTVFGPGGQFDSCLVGNPPPALGNLSGVNTGWNTVLPANWTISFWLGAGLVDGNPSYICGDPGVGSLRIFFGGIAGANTIGIRGPIADLYMTNIYTAAAMVCTIVWNGTNIIVYKNGVQFGTYPRTFTSTTGGTGWRVGSYNTAAVSHIVGKLDEFRFYNRALTPAEITATWNIELPAGGTLCNYYSSLWCPLSAFPNLPSATYFTASDWLGDTLYLHLPSSAGAAATTVVRYTWNGSWTTGVPIPVAKAGGTLTECNGKLYYIGGGSSITIGSTDVYEYNPSAGTWTTKAPMPLALSAHGAVNWGDSVIFIVGGPYTGAGTNLNVYYYRPASNTWGTITNSLPSGQGRRTFAIGITAGNKIVISCGFNTVYLNSTYVGTIGADASSITWVAAPNAPIALSRPAGASYGNYFYLVGGDTNTTAVKNTKVFLYSAQSNSWFYTVLNNPNAVSNICSGVTAHCINDTVRVFQPGGYTTVGTLNFCVLGCGPTITGNSTIISNTPTSYLLSQNYPNPFNPTTKISFSLPKAGDVKLVVYDILGKEVATLVNDYRTAGTHQVEFNASNLASGVYLYRIEAGEFRDVKRMMLVK